MNKVSLGTLKKKNYTGIKALFRKLFLKPNFEWVIIVKRKEIPLSEIPLSWNVNRMKTGVLKIDDSFNGKEVGFEYQNAGRKKYAVIKTFYPEVFRKIYPSLID